ncbi:MAG: outer membrane protein assembly factor BamD [Acidobacteriaceae bacterium]
MTTGVAAAALLTAALRAPAQAADAAQSAAGQQAAPATAATPADAAPAAEAQPKTVSLSNQKPAKTRKEKEDKVIQSKDTRKEVKKTKQDPTLEGKDAKLPDKELYDKAEDAVKHGRYDVARLELQDLLNTYPDSQYMMPAKLAIADSWFKEGGLAALTQAEQEYKDFITFFPNSPEAAEAQMRVGDIYFKQMDRPDRDYASTIHAEEAYRLMLQQFPDSPLVPQARQKLREVQETLASRESDIAAFYATHSNWPATIARYQTVVDTYPLYSHMDDVLVGLGDAYESEAHFVRLMRLPEAGKARLEKIYDDQAAAAYRKVVLEHSAAAHVEDARDRLAAMGLPIPTPTQEQAADSAALENSRGQYTLSKRATVIFLREADTVPAATIGAPPLQDAKPTNAAMMVKQSITDFNMSMNPAAYAQRSAAPVTPGGDAAAATDAAATAATPAASEPLAFQDVPSATAGDSASPAVLTSVSPATPAATGGSSVGLEIVQPSSGSTAPVTAPASPPAFPGVENAAPATAAPASDPPQSSDANGGLKAVGPPDSTPLAPVEKAATAPDAINEVTPGSQPPAQTASADGKKAKPALDKSDESSSKHKPKKGLAKLNPF